MSLRSPRVIYWVGEPGHLAEDLYQRLDAHLKAKQHQTEAGISIGKFARINELLADAIGQKARRYSNALDVIDIDSPLAAMSQSHGGGLLAQVVVGDILDIAKDVTRKIQTIGYFGFEHADLTWLAKAISGRGGYRIVPIGQALQFDITWNGVALVSHLTRKITINI
jgi:hypothetical protein